MMYLDAVLNSKPHRVVAISKKQPVAKALERMVREKTDALLVTDDDQPWGLFTANDLLLCLHYHPQNILSNRLIEDSISGKLITAEKSDPVGATVNMMVKLSISHLPVLQERAVVGMVTLTDLMAFQIQTLMSEIDSLEGYIADLQSAELD